MKYNYHEISESQLNSIEVSAGSIYFTTDSGKLFLDPVGVGVRKLIGGDFEKYYGNNFGGNVDLTGVVKSVNGQTPDENGNVEIETAGATNEQVSNAVDAFFGKTPPAAVSVDVDEEGTIVLTGGEYYEDGNGVAY